MASGEELLREVGPMGGAGAGGGAGVVAGERLREAHEVPLKLVPLRLVPLRLVFLGLVVSLGLPLDGAECRFLLKRSPRRPPPPGGPAGTQALHGCYRSLGEGKSLGERKLTGKEGAYWE